MRKHLWKISALFGAAIMAIGLTFIVLGFQARGEVRNGLRAERITTKDPAIQLTYAGARAPKDVEVPEILVDTPSEAKDMAEMIRIHSLNLKGSEGKTYPEMSRDDPNRATYLNGVTLRTALMQAYMAFRIADMIIAIGAIIAVIGAGIAMLISPALYWGSRANRS